MNIDFANFFRSDKDQLHFILGLIRDDYIIKLFKCVDSNIAFK